MVGLATSGEVAVVQALTGVLVSATGSYVSLHTADSGTTTIAAEVVGGAYQRQSVAWSQASAPNPTVQSNSALITFPTASAAWGTITNFGLNSAVSAGTYYGGGLLTTAKAVNNGDTARFAIGALTITVN